MPPSTDPMTSTIVLPPITAFDYPSREAPVPGPIRHSTFEYLPYPPHYPSTSPPDPRTSYHQNLETFQPTQQIWPGHSYPPQPGRLPTSLPPEANLLPTQPVERASFKEVKRRTKSGCQTCRKRRIKCDEARPACRNCVKSKRACLGYDPTIQAHSSTPFLQNQQPIPRSHPDDYHPLPPSITQSELPFIFHRAPSISSRTSSITGDSPLSRPEYPRPGDAILPPILSRSPEAMEHHASARGGDYGNRSQTSQTDPNQPIRRAKRCTIDELCTIDGTQRPNLPPLPSDPPNLDAIKTIFDTAFAPGLDKLLETKWFSESAFQYLVGDRAFLSQILAYITLIHNHTQSQSQSYGLGIEYPGGGGKVALASQEARISWALLGLCVRPQPPTPRLRCLKGRLHAISVILTADGVPGDGVVVCEDYEGWGDEGATAMRKQERRREREFWNGVGRVVGLCWNYGVREQRDPGEVKREVKEALGVVKQRLDGREGRDLVYSILCMRYLGERWGDGDGMGDQSGDVDMDGAEKEREKEEATQEWNVARKFLEEQAGGRSGALVLSVIAGMAWRAWA